MYLGIDVGTSGVKVVLTNDGKLYSTGFNSMGELGLGDTTNRFKFEPVALT